MPDDASSPRRAMCRTHGLALGGDGRCVLCRREDVADEGRPIWQRLVLASPLAIVALVAIAYTKNQATPQVTPEPTRAQRPAAVAPGEPLPEASPEPSPEAPPAPRAARADSGDAAAIEREMQNVPIKVYTTSWCPHCTRARKWLATTDYDATFYDVERDREARKARRRLQPARGVPAFDIDGEVLVGFSPQRVTALVRRRAAARLRER